MAIEKNQIPWRIPHEIKQKIEEFCPLNDEIIAKLEDFVKKLLNYNQKYNLIGQSTIPDIWNRHILDSAQLIKFIPDKSLKIVDIGSGAGLPAIILSILGVKEIHLIEKSFRKCEFLEDVKNISGNKVVIHQKKVEEMVPIKFDIITSRAFAPLDKILKITKNLIHPDSIAIFPKGKNFINELNLAKENNKFTAQIFPSLTSSEGNILVINQLI